MPDGLTFQIQPEGETASLDLFVRVLEDVRKLVIEVDYAVNRERSGKRWAVTRLHSSAPTFTIAPADADLRATDAIFAGIGEITQGTDAPPRHFTEDVLKRLIKMRRHFHREGGANYISVSANGHDPVMVTSDIGDKVSRILDSGYGSLGSLEGRLEAVNFHRQPSFTIWERVSRAPVRCSLPNDRNWKDRAKSLLEKRVLVQGRIRYFSNGVPRSISSIVEILDNTPDPSLPKAGFGSIPDTEAAKDPAEFLRAIRGFED
jgi:hypothetical protein